MHQQQLARVITRSQAFDAGNYTKLRATSRTRILEGMENQPFINIEKLEADMAAYAKRTSSRSLSLLCTNQENQDWYRNYVKKGQNKRISASVFVGIVDAIGGNIYDYIQGVSNRSGLPNESVLSSTFAVLLSSLGIDPHEGGRAQKLAKSFPDALARMKDLQENVGKDLNAPIGEGVQSEIESGIPT